MSHQSYSISPPPILTLPHQGGRDLYLPLSAIEGEGMLQSRHGMTGAEPY
jgi:hypothetical protein